MATEILMRNKYTGAQKTGVYGFSWTYLLFGFFVPMVRGEVGEGFKHALLGLVTCGIYSIVQWFSYNKNYMQRMMAQGWELAGTPEQNAVASASIGMGGPLPQMQAPAPVIVQMPAQGVAPAQGTAVQQGTTQQLPPRDAA